MMRALDPDYFMLRFEARRQPRVARGLTPRGGDGAATA